MKHYTNDRFWAAYEKLPEQIQKLADRSYQLLKQNPRHPSLQLKKVGARWSVRIGLHFRALAEESSKGLAWYWIGSHDEYDARVEQMKKK